MKQKAFAAALMVALTCGAVAPALADGAASTRNIIILGTAAGFAIVNYNHKMRAKRAQQQEVDRRQTAYRQWFYQKNSYYPTYDQFKQWYFQTYGVNPE
jgi:hypothetical protein